MMNALKALAIAGVVALGTAACDENPVDPAQAGDEAQFVRGGNPQPELPTIVDIVLEDDGEFDVLQTLVIGSGLAGTLSGNRPFTVFAPTDAAFGRLFDTLGVPGATPEEQAEAVCPAGIGCPDFVVTTLLYHVVNGRRFSESVTGAQQLRTLMGDRLRPDGLTLNTTCPNSAEIIAGAAGETFDIAAKNGVIHVVTEVLLPREVCEAL